MFDVPWKNAQVWVRMFLTEGYPKPRTQNVEPSYVHAFDY
jgi:hypothetical protein